jgi:phosphoribosylaminoimidazole carboxylase PurE protein
LAFSTNSIAAGLPIKAEPLNVKEMEADMKKKAGVTVSIVMGSDSDLPVLKETMMVLKDFDIPYEVVLTSAHRSPERTTSFAKDAARRGIKVIIVGAGAAAHLAGVIASQTTLPVIGIPVDATSLAGLDALLSTVQMPGGIPVASMAIGKAGARNAAVLSARILALEDRGIEKKLIAYAKKMAREIEKKQEKIECLS